jgi:hypothetical protein
MDDADSQLPRINISIQCKKIEQNPLRPRYIHNETDVEIDHVRHLNWFYTDFSYNQEMKEIEASS